MPFSAKSWNYYQPIDQPYARILSSAPYHTRYWIIDEHCETHFDAPTHFLPPGDSSDELGNQTADQVPMEELFGRAVCIDVTLLTETECTPGKSPWILPSHIVEWEEQHGDIQHGEIVLFRTGWDRSYTTDELQRIYTHEPLVTKTAPGWPAPHKSTIAYIRDKGVRCVGIDAPNIGAAHDGEPAHYEGLSHGMRYVELLTDLSQLPTRNFMFLFLPVKVYGATGGPGRAVAWVPDKCEP